MGNPEASSSKAQEGDITEKHADDDFDSLFVEDEIREPPLESDQTFISQFHPETKQTFNYQSPNTSGVDCFQSFNRRQHHMPGISQNAEPRLKADSSPEPEISLRSNFIAQEAHQHLSASALSQHCVEADVEGRQPDALSNAKKYDEAAEYNIWEMAYAPDETQKPVVNSYPRRIPGNTGFQKFHPSCRTPRSRKRREEIEDRIERQTNSKFALEEIDSSPEALPSPIMNLRQAKALDNITRVESPKLPDPYQTERIAQPRHENTTPIPSATSPIWMCRSTIGGHSILKSGRRKADKTKYEPLNIPHGAQQASESWALRRSKGSEQALNAAQGRLAAAEKRKRELSQILEKINLSAKVCETFQWAI